jgi:hypothetical protein
LDDVSSWPTFGVERLRFQKVNDIEHRREKVARTAHRLTLSVPAGKITGWRTDSRYVATSPPRWWHKYLYTAEE